MEAIYSLLRDNKTSGPFSLKQLSSMALTPADLVWVEGSSMKWEKPQEVEGLGVSFLSSAANEILTSKPAEKVELVVKYSRSLDDKKHNIICGKRKNKSSDRLLIFIFKRCLLLSSF